MGVYSNTVSFAQYRVVGELPSAQECFEVVAAALSSRRFSSIEESAEEMSEGWEFVLTCLTTLSSLRQGVFGVIAICSFLSP